MKFLTKILCTLCLFLGLLNTVQASHIVGGEIRYECLGNDQYEITILVYRDSVNGNPGAPFDNPLQLGVFDATTGAYLQTDTFSYMGHTTVANPPYLSHIVPPTNIGFQKATYTKTLTLPYRATGYTLSYQRCCRNQIITNITYPSSTGFTLTTDITSDAQLNCNNSPTPNTIVPLFLCLQDSFQIDMGATDIDGDSVSYDFYTPFSGATAGNPAPQIPSAPPYAGITWKTPYLQDTQIYHVNLNPTTGLFSGYLLNSGHYAIGLRIKEYKNGTLISNTYRDFSITVVPCVEISSTQQVQKLEGITLSPNPVVHNLQITASTDQEVQLSLYSSLGQRLNTSTFRHQTQLDMSDMPKGIYMVELWSENKRRIQKVVKQ